MQSRSNIMKRVASFCTYLIFVMFVFVFIRCENKKPSIEDSTSIYSLALVISSKLWYTNIKENILSYTDQKPDSIVIIDTNKYYTTESSYLDGNVLINKHIS